MTPPVMTQPVTIRPVLHLVFHPSAAMDLRRALAMAGRADRVVARYDDDSFGPIGAPDRAARAKWVKKTLGQDGWDEVLQKDEAFWTAALTEDCRRVAWPSRRSAQDYAGFLELLWRLGETPCEIVDLTDFEVTMGTPPTPRLAFSLGVVPAEQILAAGLLDSARPLDDASRETYRDAWQKLRSENAALRVVQSDLTLASAPLNHFDQQFLACTAGSARTPLAIGGRVLGEMYGGAVRPPNDLVVLARVRALMKGGRWPGKT